jgi:tetratricopeptide (TPR) repeat protein
MVTLTAKILRQFTAAQGDDHPLDLFSLGKWQLTLGLEEEAELNYRRAAAADLPLDYYHRSLQQLGLLLKRDGRRQEAVPIWQQWAATSMKDVDAHVELAKHYEWHERDLQTAVLWTERALTLLGSWTPQQTTLIRPQLEHRLTRLRRKLGRSE